MKKNVMKIIGLILNFLIGFNLITLVLVFCGYTNLAMSLLENFIQTIVIVVSFYSLHQLAKRLVIKKYRIMHGTIKHAAILTFWSMFIINILLVFTMAIILLLCWGMTVEHMHDLALLIIVKGVKVGNVNVSLAYLSKAIAIFVIIYYLFQWISHLLEQKVFKHSKIDISLKHTIVMFTRYAGIALAIVATFYSLGLSSTSITFILSAFTFGVSFGLKEIFSNIISGFIMLVERPITVGDIIIIENERATIKKIRLRMTVAETREKQTLMIPNSTLITSMVRNDSLNPTTRLKVFVECEYDEDTRKVEQVLMTIAKQCETVLQAPPPKVVFYNFNPSGLQFRLTAYCQLKNRLVTVSYLRHEIAKQFQQHNITIPYEKRVLYIHNESDNNASDTSFN